MGDRLVHHSAAAEQQVDRMELTVEAVFLHP